MSDYPNFHSSQMQPGAALGMLPMEVSLVADNTALAEIAPYQLLKITSDNTTAANRTFTIPNGAIVGQQLLLTLISAGATTCQLADSGNVALSAAWEPTQDDTLSLVWQGSKWIEVARADN